MKEIAEKAKEIADELRKRDEVLVVTHIDADGITSGTIALKALSDLGVECDVMFVKNLDEDVLSEIADKNVFVWFTDLGSGYIPEIVKSGIECVITDHHIPKGYYRLQLNPHDFGYDGSYDLSGAGATYLVAKELNRMNGFESIPLAIVGAVGDLQDSKDCRLKGLNKYIVAEGIRYRLVGVMRDLRLFGKQTRPIFKMLEYTYDPFLPGISGNERGAIEFLRALGIKLKDDKWRRWIDLSREEKRLVVSELVRLCMRYEYPLNYIKRLVGDCYILLNQEEGTELRDAMEFSTLLNATARYNQCEVGLQVCFGVFEKNGKFELAFKKAKRLLQEHRKNLSNGIKLVENRIVELENVQYFHAGYEILDTIVGIVAGMCYSRANLEKPIIGFAYTEKGVKVSARATQRLVERGVNLAEAIRLACEKVGGSGGGHKIAAGAIIPKGSEEEFIRELDKIIGKQLKS
jgi:RecJ-like exonuclease